MIVNEMAGSGGDLMPYMFKRAEDWRACWQTNLGRPGPHR
jgi:hypothetical protein